MLEPESLVIWKSSDSDGADPVLAKVVGPVDPDEYDREDVGPLFTICLPDGNIVTAFADELTAAEQAPDFGAMSAPELSAWYVEHVGYDLAEDDKTMSLEEFRLQCGEMYALHNL